MKTFNILIVEDHPFQQMYLQHLFSKIGTFNLELAQDGEEALMHLQKRDFDLVLTDLMMPRMDGVQFIQHFTDLRHKPDLAIMSSASWRMLKAASLVAKNLGVDVLGLISKPVEPTSLGNLIDQLQYRHLKKAQAIPQLREFSCQTLIDALKNNAFKAFFQPKKSLLTGRIVAAEALVRWMHPEQGVLLPGEFLSAMKAYNLEERLVWVMLRQAIDAQARWRQLGYEIPISINLPTHLLNSHDLADRLLDFVLRLRGNPGRLCFELMECSVPETLSNFYAGACRLRMKGFGLSQDDFGKGHSSYLSLISTPFTELKIDRALVQRCDESESLALALASIVALGRKLGLTVVAEGVETQKELEVLRSIGCNQVQGFLISRAVSSSQFQHLLRRDGPPSFY